MPKKQLTGIVISNKMQKTVVVEVEKIKEHPKYRRIYKVHKKYKAHDEKGECKVGDKVIIEECRPMSKEKRWRVIKKLMNN
jgi:small subunit ribosomal protein S17